MNTWKQRTWGDIDGKYSNAEGSVQDCAKQKCGDKPATSGVTALMNWMKCLQSAEAECQPKSLPETNSEPPMNEGRPSSGPRIESSKPPVTKSWLQGNKNNLILAGVILAVGITGIIIYKKMKK